MSDATRNIQASARQKGVILEQLTLPSQTWNNLGYPTVGIPKNRGDPFQHIPQTTMLSAMEMHLMNSSKFESFSRAIRRIERIYETIHSDHYIRGSVRKKHETIVFQ